MAASLKSERGVSHGHPFTHLLHKGSVSSGDWYKDTLQYYYIQWWCDTMQGDLMVLWQCLVIQYYILQWLLHFTVCYTCICMWRIKNLNPEETQLHQIFKKLSWRLQLKSTSGSMIQCMIHAFRSLQLGCIFGLDGSIDSPWSSHQVSWLTN